MPCVGAGGFLPFGLLVVRCAPQHTGLGWVVGGAVRVVLPLLVASCGPPGAQADGHRSSVGATTLMSNP